jgi:hypothetical protein
MAAAGAAPTVTLETAGVGLESSPGPYSRPKASIAAVPHRAITILPLRWLTIADCTGRPACSPGGQEAADLLRRPRDWRLGSASVAPASCG